MTSPHIPFRRIADLVEGRLLAGEQAQLLAHLATCPRCTSERVWVERVIGLMRTDETKDTPPSVIAHAVRLFRPRIAQPAPGLLQRVVATLRFDSAQLPLAFGVRAGQPAGRQLLFNAEQYDVDLRVKPAGEAWQVSGQVLGPCTGGQVVLQRATSMTQAMLNDLCEFTLPPVSSGRYVLILRLAVVEIEVTQLALGA